MIQRVIRLLSFSAGREAVADPRHSDLLSAAADEMKDILTRTAP